MFSFVGINANWSCIARHTYRLLTCFVNVNSLTANNVREDMLTESCRYYIQFSFSKYCQVIVKYVLVILLSYC